MFYDLINNISNQDLPAKLYIYVFMYLCIIYV